MTRRGLLAAVAAGGPVYLTVVALAAASGGYHPVSWGWAAAGIALVVIVALLVRGVYAADRAGLATVAAWGLLICWAVLSLVWSIDVTLSVLEIERDIVCLVAALALLALCRRRSALPLLMAVWAAIVSVCVYSLVTHLFPDRYGVFSDPSQPGRLYQPFGYWNALGLFLVLGTLLALGLVSRSRGAVALRCAAGASVPILVCTTYFTFSRGAWLALAIGAVAVLCASRDRLGYLVGGVAAGFWAVPGVLVAAHFRQLTTRRAIHVARASAQGGHLLVVLIVLAGAAALTMWLLATAEKRVSVSPRVRRLSTVGLGTVAVCAVVALTIARGGPAAAVRDAYQGLTGSPAHVHRGDLSMRLSSLSLDNRPVIWRVAIGDFESHLLLGSGAGTFRDYWYAHRPRAYPIVYTHNLYLQMLAELGPVGLLLLLAGLAIPLAVGLRRRGDPLLGAALGPYVAFGVHAAVDWDWQFPAIVIVAFACGRVLLTTGRHPQAAFSPGARLRRCLALAAATALVLSFVGLVANRATSAALSDLSRQRWSSALAQARVAHTWAPWSPQPDVIEGHAYVNMDDRPAALAAYRRAISIDPGWAAAWRGVAGLTYGTARTEAITKLRSLDPMRPPPRRVQAN
jgi:hypothetical protein